ncbi:hypothetical protein QQ020_22175 [Fulvivirgaceae bacterium BMA12]|uniref:Beta-carotene 15,15'-monooxygenase n=1 Tax=Agaribacillus aureus TaxID=3051825 RepID=A0ABT8LES4_9BACT|nr:hypothetical protein [Fulvivirgaceae bacterium BMA12]
MNRIIEVNRHFITFGIPFCLFGILILLMKSTLLNANDALSLGISIDLLIVVPLVYFLLIRKTEIPKTTVIPVMVIGLIIGTYFLPQESQIYLTLFKTWGLPVIEVSVLTFVAIKVGSAIRKYKTLKSSTPDFFIALKDTCYEILPKKLVLPFATEVAVFYYGFVDWKTRELNKNEFSYHKNSGTPALMGAIIFMIVIETFVLHMLIERWSINVAWILSILSAYTAVQFLGFAKSLARRPISLNNKSLTLRYGIMNEAEIHYSEIDTVTLSKKDLEKDKLTKRLSPLGELEGHNVIIKLKRENTLTGLYGIKKKFKVIGFHIDEPNDFKEKIENVLQ